MRTNRITDFRSRIRGSIVLLLPTVIVGALWVRASQTSGGESRNLPGDPQYLQMAIAATHEPDRVLPAAKLPFDSALSLTAPIPAGVPAVERSVSESSFQSSLFSLAGKPLSALVSSAAGKFVEKPAMMSPVLNCDIGGKSN